MIYGDVSLVEDLARKLKGLGRNGEGMMHPRVLLQRPVHRIGTLAQQDVVVSNVEARHDVVP
jgi:hypothetical protein